MSSLQHPSTLLHPEWIYLINNDTAEFSENRGCLHPLLLQLIHQQGWFKMLAPAKYGGQQRTLPEIVRIEEALSWADGSLGWVVTLCSGAGWFGGFLLPEVASRILNENEMCIAGSGAPTGTAIKSEGGYVVDGSWKYASGAAHATAFTANCVLINDGYPLLDESGKPLVRTFIFEKKEVQIQPTWSSIGLKATGSHTYEVKELEVPAERCFEVNVDRLDADDHLYKFPFLQLAEVTLAVNSSGMALRFIDLASDAISKRLNVERLTGYQCSVLRQTLKSTTERMDNIRAGFYEALESSWKRNEEGELSQEHLNRVSLLSRQLAQISRSCVDDLYPYCGLVAANPQVTINRVWRDLHTASQHSLLTFAV